MNIKTSQEFDDRIDSRVLAQAARISLLEEQVASLQNNGEGGSNDGIVYTPEMFGALGIGLGRTLENLYGNTATSLAQAQEVYPNATSLDESPDDLGCQNMIDYVILSGLAKSNKMRFDGIYVLTKRLYFNYGFAYARPSSIEYWASIDVTVNGSFKCTTYDSGVAFQGLRRSYFRDLKVVGLNTGITRGNYSDPLQGLYGQNSLDINNWISPANFFPFPVTHDPVINQYYDYCGVIGDPHLNDVSASGKPFCPPPDVSKSTWVSKITAVGFNDLNQKWYKSESSDVHFIGGAWTGWICGFMGQPSGSGAGNFDFVDFTGVDIILNTYGATFGASQMRNTFFKDCKFSNYINLEDNRIGEQKGQIEVMDNCHISGVHNFVGNSNLTIKNNCYGESFSTLYLGSGKLTLTDNPRGFRFGHPDHYSIPMQIITGHSVQSTNTYFAGTNLDMLLTGEAPVFDGNNFEIINSFQWDAYFPFPTVNNGYLNANVWGKIKNHFFYTGRPLLGQEWRGTNNFSITQILNFKQKGDALGGTAGFPKQPYFKYVQPGSTGLPNDYMYTNATEEGNHITLGDFEWIDTAGDIEGFRGKFQAIAGYKGTTKVNMGDLFAKGDYFVAQDDGLKIMIYEIEGDILRFIFMNGYDYNTVRKITKYHFGIGTGTYSSRGGTKLELRNPDKRWDWFSNSHLDTKPMTGTISGNFINGINYELYPYETAAQGHFAETEFEVGSPIYYFGYEGHFSVRTTKWEVNKVKSINDTTHAIELEKAPSSLFAGMPVFLFGRLPKIGLE